MDTNIEAIDNITDLRNKLRAKPGARLAYAKAVTDFLAAQDISVSGTLLGKLNIASCDELVSSNAELIGTWTN